MRTEDHAGKANDIFELLRRDHHRVSRLLDQIEGTSADDGRRREQLFEQLVAELEIHSQAEDDIFYSTLEQLDDLEDLIDEARQEHDLVEDILEELDAVAADGNDWLEKLRELRQLFEHHVDMEENRIFALAREYLASDQAVRLGEQFLRAKETVEAEVSGERAMITETGPVAGAQPGELPRSSAPASPSSDRDEMASSEREDIEQLSKKELYQLARQRRIGGRSAMTKAQLVEAIRSSR